MATSSTETAALQGVLICTTSKYLFVYDSTRALTRILPVENIAQVLVPRRRFGSSDSATAGIKASPLARNPASIRPK